MKCGGGRRMPVGSESGWKTTIIYIYNLYNTAGYIYITFIMRQVILYITFIMRQVIMYIPVYNLYNAAGSGSASTAGPCRPASWAPRRVFKIF